MKEETYQITEKDALSIYARMMHTLDSSEFESFLSEDFSYSSQKVLTDMNSKDEFIEYIRPKLEIIKKTKSSVFAELGVCPAYGHTDCLVMAQGDKSNLLGVAYASVNDGKISGLSLCIAPTPDAAIRSGIYPGLNEVDPDLNEKKDQVIITEEEFQPKKKQLLDFEKETYQIQDYLNDEVIAFAGVFSIKGKFTNNEDEMISTDRLKLESYNPEDTIPVATFLMKSTPPKKHIFMLHHLQN